MSNEEINISCDLDVMFIFICLLFQFYLILWFRVHKKEKERKEKNWLESIHSIFMMVLLEASLEDESTVLFS